MRKGTVYTHDTRAGSPGGRGGGQGAGATNQSVCGQQRQKGGRFQAEPFQPALGVRGSPAVCTPAGPPSTGRERGMAAPLGLAADSGVSGSPWVLVETASGEAPSQAHPEKGALFPPRAPVKAGGMSPSVLPRKGWGGAGGWSLQPRLIFRSRVRGKNRQWR